MSRDERREGEVSDVKLPAGVRVYRSDNGYMSHDGGGEFCGSGEFVPLEAYRAALAAVLVLAQMAESAQHGQVGDFMCVCTQAEANPDCIAGEASAAIALPLVAAVLAANKEAERG